MSTNGKVLLNGLSNYMNRSVSHSRTINAILKNTGMTGYGMKTAAAVTAGGIGLAAGGYAYNKRRGDRTFGGNSAIAFGLGHAAMGLKGLGAGRLMTGAGMSSLGKKLISMGNSTVWDPMKGNSLVKGGANLNKLGMKMTSTGQSVRSHMSNIQSSNWGTKARPYLTKGQGLFNKARSKYDSYMM